MGRHKHPDARIKEIRVRMTVSEKRELQERLAMEGMELSSYIRALIDLDKKEGYICRY